VTVSRAVASLSAQGIVVSRPGSGTYVAPRRPSEDARYPDTAWQAGAMAEQTIDERAIGETLGGQPFDGIHLAGGYIHRSLQPTKALSAALARAARRPDAWDRAAPEGLAPLRSLFAADAGSALTADDVMITNGGQSALSLIFRAIGTPGDPVLVESPTYPGALAAIRAAGLRPIPVPIDAEGVRTDMLAEGFAKTGARLFYCQPAFQNPTGAVLSAERRAEVRTISRAAGAFIVEDDFARHLGHGVPTPAPLLADDDEGAVIYVTSLTKPAAPSLRIGAILARGPVMRRLRTERRVDDFFVARPMQEATIELLSSAGWSRHVRTLGASLKERSRALRSYLATELTEWSVAPAAPGGVHVWVQAPDGADDPVPAAREGGVTVSAGRGFFPAEPSGNYVRINFAAATDVAELIRGAGILVAAASR
jgi:DNA-binding transcriptional MocR family regulator